jgi:hypothetical protein
MARFARAAALTFALSSTASLAGGCRIGIVPEERDIVDIRDTEEFFTRLRAEGAGREFALRILPPVLAPDDHVREFVSPVSDARYAYYEIVACLGELSQPCASFMSLHHTEADIRVLHEARGLRAAVSYRRMRAFLKPAFEARVKPGDPLYATVFGGEESGDGVPAEAADRSVLLMEYGLVPGREYFARVEVESYFLPPAGPGAEPRRRETLVLHLSDLPAEPSADGAGFDRERLTPLYRAWSY